MASHATHRSLPPRTHTHRPRAVSLSEYQPLAFDRDAIQAAYQSQLTLPSVSSSATGHGLGAGTGTSTGTGMGMGSSGQVIGTNSASTVPTTRMGLGYGTDSSRSGSGSGDGNGYGSGSGGHPPPQPASTSQRMSFAPTSSNLTSPGADLQAPVPVWATDEETARRAGSGNFTGIGAGHSLTPPGSPMHRAARERASSFSQSPSHSQNQIQLQDGSDQAHPQTQAHALSPIPASPAVHSPVTGVGFVYPSHPPPPMHESPPSTRNAGFVGVGGDAEGLEGRTNRLGVDDALDIQSPAKVYAYNPIGSDGQLVNSTYTSPAHHPGVSGPALPLRPPIAGSSARTGLFNSRNHGTGRMGTSGQAEDDGWDSDPGFPRYVGGNRGGRRVLPAVPDNVPAPPPPAWEPDYKPQIPSSLTQPSIDNAYAQLSAPPPGVTPRVRPNAQTYNTNASAGPSQPSHPTSLAQPSLDTSSAVPITPMEGAPDFPPTSPIIPMSPIQILSQRPPRPKLPRPAEDRIHLRADGRTPIWSTHYLDPALRNTVVSVPAQLSNLGNMALSGLAGGEKTGWNSTTGAPIDGMARLAKEWFLPPDGRFTADKGPIELSVGVVDAGETGWGREKGRKRARVEVVNKAGGIKVELIEVDDDRQIDLKVESKTGDILVLLPADFFGTIHVSSPSAPHFCRLVGYNKARTANPNEVFWSTFIVPPDISILASAHGSVTNSKPSVAELTPRERKIRAARPVEHKAALGTAKYMPDFLKGQDPMVDQVISAYAAHTRGEWSKVHVTNMGSKGRIVFGYRESEDEEEIREMGLRVGVQHEKRRRWWNR